LALEINSELGLDLVLDLGLVGNRVRVRVRVGFILTSTIDGLLPSFLHCFS